MDEAFFVENLSLVVIIVVYSYFIFFTSKIRKNLTYSTDKTSLL